MCLWRGRWKWLTGISTVLCSIRKLDSVRYHAVSVTWYVFTRATLASAGISCRRVSICLSVCSSVSLSQADVLLKQLNVGSRRQRYTIARDSRFLMPKISAKRTESPPPQRRRQMQVGYVKCRCGSWKLATFDAKRCQLSSVASLSHSASTLRVCSMFAATADPCSVLTEHSLSQTDRHSAITHAARRYMVAQ